MTDMPDMFNDVDEAIGRLLRGLRRQLGLDVAYVSELDGHLRVFRYVDTDMAGLVEVGGVAPAGESYCRAVVDGRLPRFLSDPAAHPVSAALPSTGDLPVGTHLSVPVRFSDGSVYGTLCGFTLELSGGLDEGDLGVLHVLADIVGGYLEEREGQRRQQAQRRSRLHALTGELDLLTVFQPIVELASGGTVGFEALARFPSLGQAPDRVFADAWQLGLGAELELKAIRAALEQASQLPDGAYLSMNASPATLTREEFGSVLDGVANDRVVLEVTEHAAISDTNALLAAVRPMAQRGVRLAIDDAGAGFAGLQQILELSPDIIKLDGALVRGVDTCPAKQAMLSAVVSFTSRTQTTLIAEAVETAAELAALRVLGVGYGQGYHVGRPHSPPANSAPPPTSRATASHAPAAPESITLIDGHPAAPSKLT